MRDKLSEIVPKNCATGDNFSQLSPKIMRQMSIICRQNSRDNWRNLSLNIASIVARLMAIICHRNSRDNKKKCVKKVCQKFFKSFTPPVGIPRIYRASVCASVCASVRGSVCHPRLCVSVCLPCLCVSSSPSFQVPPSFTKVQISAKSLSPSKQIALKPFRYIILPFSQNYCMWDTIWLKPD